MNKKESNLIYFKYDKNQSGVTSEYFLLLEEFDQTHVKGIDLREQQFKSFCVNKVVNGALGIYNVASGNSEWLKKFQILDRSSLETMLFTDSTGNTLLPLLSPQALCKLVREKLGQKSYAYGPTYYVLEPAKPKHINFSFGNGFNLLLDGSRCRISRGDTVYVDLEDEEFLSLFEALSD